jgi:hypothetical protein
MSNPIIAAIKRSRAGKPRTTIMIDAPGFPQLSDEQLDQSIRVMFGQETVDEIGIAVLRALLLGDREAAKKMVSKAVDETDHIFRRAFARSYGDPAQDLLKQALQCLYEHHGKPFKNGLKRTVEDRFYGGKLVSGRQWNRVRQQLGWLTDKEARARERKILRTAKRLLKP